MIEPYNNHIMTPLIFLLLAAALCSDPVPKSSYHGFRVVKSCNSMMKDDMELMKEIDFNTINPKEIKESNGDYILALSKFKTTKFDQNILTFSKCNVINSGTLQAFKEVVEQTIDFSFEWNLVDADSLGSKGPGTLTLKVKEMKLLQEYIKKVNTKAEITWEVLNVKMSGAEEDTQNWGKGLLNKNFGNNVNEEVNKKLMLVSEKIIKSYTEFKIAMEGNEPAVVVENEVHQALCGKGKGQDFIVLNFRPTFKSSKHSYNVTASLETSFDSPKPFDYKVCYSSRFFGGFIDFRAQFQSADERFLNEFKESDYPSRVAFFRRFVPNVSLRYAEDVKVATHFRGDQDKRVQYTGKSIIVPSNCDFASEGQRFMRFKTEYEVSCEPTVENQRVRVTLAVARIASFTSEPEIENPALLPAADFANAFRELVAGYVIAKKEGLFVDTVRNKNYKFLDKDIKGEEICLLYKDTEKHAY
eukprot:TRINITY_DN383_c0_g3_i2.p1 TRINITY_DN383_c0_g3~~TRINITY_DN383_c0_g3_i2.p1  ORF type:complete len:472 (-),score=111.50 TRINITY_DN383_c0_g3_i2:174-1589(-)